MSVTSTPHRGVGMIVFMGGGGRGNQYTTQGCRNDCLHGGGGGGGGNQYTTQGCRNDCLHGGGGGGGQNHRVFFKCSALCETFSINHAKRCVLSKFC